MKNTNSNEPHMIFTMAMRDCDWSFGKVISHLMRLGFLVMGEECLRATQTIEITCASDMLTEMFHCEDRLGMFNEFLVFPKWTLEYGNVIIIQKWDDDKAEYDDESEWL